MLVFLASGEQGSWDWGVCTVGKGKRNEDDLNQWSSKYDIRTPGLLTTLLLSSAGQNY